MTTLGLVKEDTNTNKGRTMTTKKKTTKKKKLEWTQPIQTSECEACSPVLSLVDNVAITVRHGYHNGGDECATVNIKGLVQHKLVERILKAFQDEGDDMSCGLEFQVTYTCSDWNEREWHKKNEEEQDE